MLQAEATDAGPARSGGTSTRWAAPAMSRDALPSRRQRLAELDEGITRAEMQIMLLATGGTVRAGGGLWHRAPRGLRSDAGGPSASGRAATPNVAGVASPPAALSVRSSRT